MAEMKTIQTEASVEDFINLIENDQKREDCFEIVKMMKQVTKKEPKMWGPSIIGFGQYHYRYESGREGEMPRLAFSPRKGNTVFYINGGFENYAEIMDRLGKYKTGKGCLYVRSLADVDKAALVELLR